MEIPKTYDPSAVEEKIYQQWQEKGFFHSEPDDREAYTIVMPPPNVTGILHMGHALNNTVQDVLVRKARMEGKNACWIPGTDHASIATEAKVVQWLKEKGIHKSDLSREEFLKYCWEWTDKYGGIILEQLKKLGASCDWQRTHFTMEPEYYASVIKIFVDLYNEGKIYRGVRMINWDPQAKTALSDEEVIFKDKVSKLYYVKYPIANTQDEYIVIATTRPETMLGDTAICVHPDDERYLALHGKSALVPLINRKVPIITDDYVEKDFGTGALKVTPAHDKNDHELGIKHNLDVIDIYNEDGTLNENAVLFIGKDRFAARKLVVKELEEKGYLIKVEEIQNAIGYSERTDAVIEPRLSKQWFCKMGELAIPALDSVMSDEVEFYPAKFKNVYRHWMENIHDWCISRQLWWGQRIPAWYCVGDDHCNLECKEPIVSTEKPEACPHCGCKNLRQDEDVLDTWFSSWLWPMAVFNGILQPNNYEIRYYYPTQVLVTAPEIIFFWVARMLMAGFDNRHVEPFEQVYFTGIVRDKLGRKMSKSLGNSPDLIELMQKYGADGVRFGILVASPAGNDLLFDDKLCEQGRNFANKIWNAMRLIKGWETNDVIVNDPALYVDEPIEWFENRLLQVLNEIEDYYEEFRLSEALTTVYKLIWDDFCASFLEMIKPTSKGIDRQTYNRTIVFFETLMKLAHPFMPFLTEEVWSRLRERDAEDFCMVAPYPEAEKPDKTVLAEADKIIDLITQIRNYRNSNGISPKEELELYIKSAVNELYTDWERVIIKMANVKKLNFTQEPLENATSIVVKTDEFFIPQTKELDLDVEIQKINEELDYMRGFLKAVDLKLANERFVQNARPDIIEKERQKKEDAEARVRMLEENLKRLVD